MTPRANTRVEIVNQPFKLGWSGDDLYLEVHPPLESSDETEDWSLTAITKLYIDVTDERAAEVDWTLVEAVYNAQQGIPVKVGFAISPPIESEAELSVSMSLD